MPYTLKRTNGTTLAIIQDGSIDKSTDLTFIGKNYAGYGQTMNENFLQLLENFSSSRQPGSPLAGQLWFDSANLKLCVYDGSRFKGLPFIDGNTTRPTDLRNGDFWYDPVNQKLYVYNGSDYVLIGPEKTAAALLSAVEAILVQRREGDNKTVLAVNIGSGANSVFGIFSKEAFIPADTSLIKTDQKYQNIARGISLPGYTPVSLGPNKGIGAIPDNEHIDTLFFGAASASWGMLELIQTGSGNQVQFFESDQYIRYNGDGISVTGSIVSTNDNGLTLGAFGSLKLNTTGNVANITNPNGTRITINTKIASSSVTALAIDYSGAAVTVVPSLSPPTDLGTPTASFRNVYATNFVGSNLIAPTGSGTITGNWTLAAGSTIIGGSVAATTSINSTNANLVESYVRNGTYVHADVADVAYSIAQRDSIGGITANGLNAGSTGTSKIAGNWVMGITGSLQATTLLGAGTTGYVAASQTGVANTIAQRDGAGALLATNVVTPTLSAGVLTSANGTVNGTWALSAGSSFEATYTADIAERYHADKEYTPGTVLVVGGVNEVTTTDIRANPRVAGIVSTEPAFKLNGGAGTDATHPYIALKGRVPCKVVGPVFKNDLLVTSSKPGYAERTDATNEPLVGIALSDCVTAEGIVEVLVK